MPERASLILAGGGVGLVALSGFLFFSPVYAVLLVVATLFGIVLGIFIGATLPPEWTEEPVLGPVAALQKRQPWTKPGFYR